MSNVTVEGNTRQTPDTLPCQLIADPDQACVWVGMTYPYDILLCKNICCYKKCYVRNRSHKISKKTHSTDVGAHTISKRHTVLATVCPYPFPDGSLALYCNVLQQQKHERSIVTHKKADNCLQSVHVVTFRASPYVTSK